MSDWLDAEAHADRALEWFERGRWAEAEAELRKAIGLNPDQAEWHFNLGLTLEAAGRDSEALASYEQAIGLMPEQVESRIAAGVVCNRLGQFDRAITRLEEVLRLDRAAENAYAHLMESYFRLGNHDEVETTYYLAQQSIPEPGAHCLAVLAESLLQRGEYQRAEWCIKQALRLDPGMPRLRARLGTVLAATGRPQRALQMYLRDLRDDPGNIDTLLDYGELLLDLRRLPDAAEKFRRVLEIEPANVDAHHRLGRIAMMSNHFEQAHLEFELVLKLDPEYPQIRLDVADALLRRGRLREGRRFLQQERIRLAGADEDGDPISVLPDAMESGYLRRFGDLLQRAGAPTHAAAIYRRSISLHGGDAEIFRSLALSLFQSGDRHRGAAASRRALRLDPTCIRSIHNLALSALQEGCLEIGAGWIRRGMALDRHDDGVRRLRMRLWLAIMTRGMRRLIGR